MRKPSQGGSGKPGRKTTEEETAVHQLPLPLRPTMAPPGSPEKIRVMCRRFAGGFHIHHPLDNRVLLYANHYARLVLTSVETVDCDDED